MVPLGRVWDDTCGDALNRAREASCDDAFLVLPEFWRGAGPIAPEER